MPPLRSLVWCAFTVALPFLLAAPPAAAAQGGGAGNPGKTERSEMGSEPTERRPARQSDPATVARFKQEYDAADANGSASARRRVFAKYLPTLGAAPMLAHLETSHTSCHAFAHDLGMELFAATRDLGMALRECGTGCTSGCMHGAVSAAFGNSTTEQITARMNRFCTEGEMARLHKPGNCAHGLGHALMLSTRGNVTRSIDACLGFSKEAMQYYCATGVYMERIITGPRSAARESQLSPCDREALFPAACYRYKALALMERLGDPARIATICLGLAARQQLACFHGLGNASAGAVYDDPKTITEICSAGNRDDRVVCLEGLIEKFADVDERRAKAACAYLSGDMRLACDRAAAWKMYNLDKPTLGLYYDPTAIAQRKAAAPPAPAPAPAPHLHH